MYLGNMLAAVARPDQYIRRNGQLRHILWSDFSTANFVPLYSFGVDFPQNLSGDREQEYCMRAVCTVLFCVKKRVLVRLCGY